jgi:hypothetical protein
MEHNELRKYRWAESDFETMEWHDCRIYAIAFDSEKFELMFDIDYIIEWVKPEANTPYFKFWVVPATLVFKNVRNINISADSVDLIIQSISRDDPSEPKNANYVGGSLEYRWTIETTNGEIAFYSIAYEQFARESPVLLDSQTIGLTARNGTSFARRIS